MTDHIKAHHAQNISGRYTYYTLSREMEIRLTRMVLDITSVGTMGTDTGQLAAMQAWFTLVGTLMHKSSAELDAIEKWFPTTLTSGRHRHVMSEALSCARGIARHYTETFAVHAEPASHVEGQATE